MSQERGSDGLTSQQRSFLEAYKEVGFDPSKRKEALLKAGYSEHTASTRGLEIEKKIHSWVITALRRRNITPDRLALVHDRLLESEDPKVQARALEMGWKLYDAFPKTNVKIKTESSRTVEVDLETLRLAEEVSGEKILDAEFSEADNEGEDALAPL